MTDIKSFRNKYGLTQAQLAFYLSVSESMIKMVESDRRTLPTTALLKLNELGQNAGKQELLNKDDQQATPFPVTEKRAVLLIQKRLDELTAAISKIERNRNSAAALQEKGRSKAGLVKMLSPVSKLKKQESSWLRLLELEAAELHNSYSSTKLQMMQIKLESLQFEKSKLQDLLITSVK